MLNMFYCLEMFISNGIYIHGLPVNMMATLSLVDLASLTTISIMSLIAAAVLVDWAV